MNSIMMLIDLAIVGQPIRMSHIYFTTGMAVIYGAFTAIYSLAGGTDRKGQGTIYPVSSLLIFNCSVHRNKTLEYLCRS